MIQYLSDHENVSITVSPKKKIHRVISTETAAALQEILTRVVDQGTGMRTRIKGYSIGGKTGTAQIAAPNGAGYLEGEYVASFMGLVPQ